MIEVLMIATYACFNSTKVQSDGMVYGGGFGNPAVFMQSATVGIGLLPRDDVFLVHAYSTQSAIAQYPGAPAGKFGCRVTSPPSIQVADSNLGLAKGDTYEQQWSIYPTSQHCPDYYCFINSARHDLWNSPHVQLNGTGYLSLNPNLPNTVYSQLEDAGYTRPWGNWTPAAMEEFLELQSMHYVTTDIPYTGKCDPCRKCPEPLYCHGYV